MNNNSVPKDIKYIRETVYGGIHHSFMSTFDIEVSTRSVVEMSAQFDFLISMNDAMKELKMHLEIYEAKLRLIKGNFYFLYIY